MNLAVNMATGPRDPDSGFLIEVQATAAMGSCGHPAIQPVDGNVWRWYYGPKPEGAMREEQEGSLVGLVMDKLGAYGVIPSDITLTPLTPFVPRPRKKRWYERPVP